MLLDGLSKRFEKEDAEEAVDTFVKHLVIWCQYYDALEKWYDSVDLWYHIL